jgi:hypothetical protein
MTSRAVELDAASDGDAGWSSVFVDGTEMLGFIVYGLWRGGSVTAASAGLQAGLHRGGAGTAHAFRLFGDGWTVLGWDLGFEDADEYRTALTQVETLLDHALGAGACVAWMGYEGLPFADPPDLFTVEWMEGGVIAAKTAGGELLSGVDATGPLRPLSPGQLAGLQAVATSCLERPAPNEVAADAEVER